MAKLDKRGKKEIFALIGDPIRHSASSCMHNAAFEKLGINAIYVILNVLPKDLKKAMEGIRALAIKGLNVTIPHKEKCMKFLDEIDGQAKKIGAVNTILNKGGKLKGYNTDSDGFIDSLKINTGINPKSKDIFIVGAGGASRAISFALAKNKAKSITFVDIKNNKTRELKKSLNKYYSKCNIQSIPHKNKDKIKKVISDCDIFINATGLGLKPDDPMVINPDFLHKDLLVCDLIYNPPMSKLLKAAKKGGIKTLNGEGMLLYQGMRAFKIWMGIRPPEDVMKKSLRAFLKSKPR